MWLLNEGYGSMVIKESRAANAHAQNRQLESGED